VSSKNLIDVTVAVPLWDMGNISWLQLESLCRQQTEFKWELIVCEEQLENFTGKQNIIPYTDRLRQAGCKSIKYIPLLEKIPLSKKWALMAHIAKGKTFLLAGGDDYSAPNRVQFTHEIMCVTDSDWFDVEKGLFYNINTGQTCTYDHSLGYPRGKAASISQGVRTAVLKPFFKLFFDCSYHWPSMGVDNWMKSLGNIRPNKFYRHEQELLSLYTDGANKISNTRSSYYSNKEYTIPFCAPTQTVEDILPLDVHSQLRELTFRKILEEPYV
jgi:hypothetical protein